MAIRYESNFKDTYGVPWKIHILDNSDIDFTTEDIILDDNGIEIDWGGKSKDSVIFSSSCTITIESTSDRKFLDLYTVSIRCVTLYVWRDGKLYWCGTLDPELYEEPYSREKFYEVSLTFSDFAILDRIKWSYTGFYALNDVVGKCLSGMGIPFYYKEHISTSRMDGNVPPNELLKKDCVLGDNFFDEDGEALTLKEVLEAVLQPYDLHIIQKNGSINIWDWNALSRIAPLTVEWDSADSVLSVDKVYNNVRLTFSPYAKSNIVNYNVKREDIKDVEKIGRVYHYNDDGIEVIDDFDIEIANTGLFKIHSQAKFFRINPLYSGSDDAGIAWTAKVRLPLSSLYDNLVQPIDLLSRETLIKTSNLKINMVNNDLFIKISLQILLSVLDNPFEKPEEGDPLANIIQKVKIPVRISLTSESGDKYYYVNANEGFTLLGEWVNFPVEAGMCFLNYYSADHTDGFFTGWQSNKKAFPEFDKVSDTMKKNNDAEYILFPPVSGNLSIEILNGLWMRKTDGFRLDQIKDKDLVDSIKWLLYKDLTVDIVDRWGKTIKVDDVEFSAWINKSAKEELSIDTIVGTLPNSSSVAQGQIFDYYTKFPHSIYERAGHTARLEQLLIGTMYSQYATRHLKLSGTVVLLPEFSTVTDANEPGVYAIMGEVQNIVEGTSEIEMVQISPDNYSAIGYN